MLIDCEPGMQRITVIEHPTNIEKFVLFMVGCGQEVKRLKKCAFKFSTPYNSGRNN